MLGFKTQSISGWHQSLVDAFHKKVINTCRSVLLWPDGNGVCPRLRPKGYCAVSYGAVLNVRLPEPPLAVFLFFELTEN